MEESMKRQERRMIKAQVKKIFSSGVIQLPVASSDDECLGDINMDTSDNTSDTSERDEMSDMPCENSFSENDFLSGSEEDLSFIDEDVIFNQDLTSWVNHYRPSREAINDLLKILSKRGLPVPKDSRTLLKSPREVSVVSKCGGTYSYLGIKAGILEALKHTNQDEDNLFLDINIDGVPLTKSSNSQLWPILGSINNSDFVFVIAVFHSFSKPSCDYLNDFIVEAKQLIKDGLNYNDRYFTFSIRSFICDSPARSFLKCIIGHAGYNSCERCCIHGTRVQNRTVFNECTFKESLRDGEKFQNCEYLGDHQKEISPLVDLGINCVRQFPLDYMHLVLLGVVKRILIFLTKGPPCSKLSHQLQLLISERMVSHNGLMPSEFNRQPRRLSELAYWKSTEYRQFLLYHAPIVLKGIVEKDVYEHFICLHVAISLLLKKDVEKSQLLFATDLLKWFVKTAVNVYGPTFTVYNVHGLLDAIKAR